MTVPSPFAPFESRLAGRSRGKPAPGPEAERAAEPGPPPPAPPVGPQPGDRRLWEIVALARDLRREDEDAHRAQARAAAAMVRALVARENAGWRFGVSSLPGRQAMRLARRSGAIARALSRRVARSLVRPSWYAGLNPELRGVKPAEAGEHYLRFGMREGRDPHPLVSAGWLATQLEGVDPKSAALWEAFYASPLHALDPHPLFDTDDYAQRYGLPPRPALATLAHYLERGAAEGHSPHPLFDPGWYRAQSGLADGEDALTDYLECGHAFGFSPHPLFDEAWYKRRNPDVAAGGSAGLVHYLWSGWREGRDPHPLFDVRHYLAANSDVAEAGIEPLRHFVVAGSREQRDPSPRFSTWVYRTRHAPELARSGLEPLEHFVRYGAAQGYSAPRAAPDPYPADPARMLDAYAEPPAPRPAAPEGAAATPSLPSTSTPAAATRPSPRPPAPAAPTRQPYVGAQTPPALRAFLEHRGDGGRVGRFGPYYARLAASRDPARLPDVLAELRGAIEARSRELGPAEGPVDASIVIPVYGQPALTGLCVLSVLEHACRLRYEILIADDASPDETTIGFLRALDSSRVRWLRADANRGFTLNCNWAAAQASGDPIVFLNNDTFVLDGWLDELVDALRRDPRAGMAGSKLLNADGTLQEAGAIIWKDGSAWNFGRDGDPAAPEFSYAKETDYVSGASIAVRRGAWDAVGGFDPRYAPAYCEDSDLAFALRERGWRAVFTPFSVAVHHEGGTHGRDETKGLKAYQVANQEKLKARWAEVWAREQLPPGEDVALARDRSRGRPHVLIVDHYAPQPDHDAGSRTMAAFIDLFLEAGFAVSFWPDNLNFDRPYVEALQRRGVETIYGPAFVDGFDAWLAARGAHLDYALLSRPHIAPKYVASIRRRSAAKILYYGHDVHSMRLADLFAKTGDEAVLRDVRRWRELETDLWASSDAIYYPSPDEADEVRRQQPGKPSRAVPAYLFDEAALADAAAESRPGGAALARPALRRRLRP